MPYTTLVAGTTITASWANANVRDQVVTPFATAAARNSAISSPVNGMVANITDDDQIVTYNGSSWVVAADYGAWGTWAPTLIQSGTVSHTASRAKYVEEGKTIQADSFLVVSGTGTAANIITMSLPVTAAAGQAIVGAGYLVDASTGLYYTGTAVLLTTTTVSFAPYGGTSLIGAAGFTAALTTSDNVGFSLTYEAA